MSRWIPETPEQRLLKRRRVNSETQCWEWTGACMSNGYGVIQFYKRSQNGGRMALVHRLAAFIWLEFDLASDLMVLHRCDNRRCFNPEHLFTGTHQDNMDDMWSKGRNQDQRHPRKLTRNAVITMRRRYAAGGITTRALAKEFGIGKSTVSAIIRMEIWADVGS